MRSSVTVWAASFVGRRSLVLWALVASAVFALPAAAQPPGADSNRWSGQTANTNPQGFAQGTPIVLTWGFMPDGTTINDSTFGGAANAPSNLIARLNTIYGSQAVWQPLFQSVFDRWSAISGITYQLVSDDGAAITSSGFPIGQLGVRPDVRIGGKNIDGNSGVLAYNYFPNVSDMVIDTNDTFFNDTTNGSIRLRNVVSHEHGHGLGMEHMDTNNAAFLMEPFIQTGFDGPQYHDILVAHRYYGDALEKAGGTNLGNDVAARATALGAIASGGQVQRGTSAATFVVSSAATDFVSIDDNTDTDFYSFSVSAAGQITLLLEAMGFTYNITAQGGGGNVAFNSLLRSDLALALIGTDGTTVLASSNSTGLGGNEQIIFNLPGAGTYFIRVTGADNNDAIFLDTQFYRLTASFTASAIPEPTTMGLFGLAGLCGGYGWLRRRNQMARLAKLDAAERSAFVAVGSPPVETRPEAKA